MSDNFLQEGDIFQVVAGMNVRTLVPNHVFYLEHEGDWTVKEQKITVNDEFYKYLIGSYIVTTARVDRIADDMGMGALREQTYTDVHYIEAVKTDNTRITISFYQNCHYGASNWDVQKTGAGKLIWVVEENKE